MRSVFLLFLLCGLASELAFAIFREPPNAILPEQETCVPRNLANKQICSGHGACLNGECHCDRGFAGIYCELASCPNNCTNRGYCFHSYGDKAPHCVCEYGFYGRDCSKSVCPHNCWGRGVCDRVEVVTTSPGYQVDTPLTDYSLEPSSERLKRITSMVAEEERRQEEREAQPDYDENAPPGHCVCDPGFTGPDCGKKVCPACVHGSCEETECSCDDGWAGVDCSIRSCPFDCSGHGTCDIKAGRCVCAPHFYGRDCSYDDRICPNQCSNRVKPGVLSRFDHGTCTPTGCDCHTSFGGYDCSYACPNGCSNHGHCEYGTCRCEPNWLEEDCSKRECTSDCGVSLGHGQCNFKFGMCQCATNWTGADCSIFDCSPICNNHGECVPVNNEYSYKNRAHVAVGEHRCECTPGDQNGLGGWTGEHCERPICPNSCSMDKHQGRCIDHKCVCARGFDGADCSHSIYPCGEACSAGGAGHGFCDLKTRQCICDAGWNGKECTDSLCQPADCGNHGVCTVDPLKHGGRPFCKCFPPFTGAACQDVTCNAKCSGHGHCLNYHCICNGGWTGEECEVPWIPLPEAPRHTGCRNKCGTHGSCRDYVCVCDSGWAGDTCEKDVRPKPTPQQVCDATCSGHGRCSNGPTSPCLCDEGWSGEHCDQKVPVPCASTCSNHGKCYDLDCHCDPGWTGVVCERRTDGSQQAQESVSAAASTGGDGRRKCDHPCSKHGQCLDFRCVCESGFHGDLCEIDEKQQAELAQAAEAKRIEEEKRKLEEERRAADEEAAKVGEMIDPKTGARVRRPIQCLSRCSGHGKCIDFRCICDVGWTGEVCETSTETPISSSSTAAAESASASPSSTGEQKCSVLCGQAQSNSHGQCWNGVCVCAAGWDGSECTHSLCQPAPDCSGHGVCTQEAASHDGHPFCTCSGNYTGSTCSDLRCTRTCSGRGECLNDHCVCSSGYEGDDCERVTGCGTECQPGDKKGQAHGNCVNSTCVCEAGWKGANCLDPIPCADECVKHGECVSGVCKCVGGWVGDSCQIKPCDHACGTHGHCDTAHGFCICDEGWSSDDCTRFNQAACFVGCDAHCSSKSYLKQHGFLQKQSCMENCVDSKCQAKFAVLEDYQEADFLSSTAAGSTR